MTINYRHPTDGAGLSDPSDQGSQQNVQQPDNSGLLPLVGDLGVIFQSPSSAQSGSSGSGGSSQAPGVTGNTSGFVINVTYDQSQSSLPTGFVAAINYVVSYYESIFTNPITVNIDVGYGEIDGQSLASGALGESETYLADYSYSTIKSALGAIDPAAASSLPSSAPGNAMWVGTAEAKALGLSLQQPSDDIDGYAGFSNVYPFTYNPNSRAVPNEYDFIGVVEHEFTEVMGRIDLFGQTIGDTSNSYSLLDMYHYTAPGSHTYTGTTTNYFSINGGTTNLDNFNTNPGGDLGDWAGSAGNDAYLAFSPSGRENTVSQTDITEMNALGYSVETAKPDLSEYVVVDNTTLAAGGSTTIHAFDINVGSGPAPASTAGIYLSYNDNITTSDILLATVTSPALAPYGSSGYYDVQLVSVTLPTNLTSGTYYIGGIADYQGQVTESNDANQTYNTVAITVTGAPPPKPDLSEYVVVDNTTLAAGGSTTVHAFDINVGSGPAPASTAGIYLSYNDDITTSDTLLATVTSPALAPYGSSGYYDVQLVSVTLPTNLTSGTYYIGGIADYQGQVAESNDANQTYNTVAITVTGPPAPKPDLSEYVVVDNTTLAAGGSTTVHAFDINVGSGPAPASTAGIYLSTDDNITTSDTLLATVTSPALAPYGSSGYYDVQLVSVTLPSSLAPGTYYIGGIADYQGQVSESNNANQTYNTVPITVTAPGGSSAPQPKPDLSEYVVVDNTTLSAGGSTTIHAFDINVGSGPAPASTAGIYLSTDDNIIASDTLLATVTSPALAAYGSSGYYDVQLVSVTLPGNLASGTYYIGGIADYQGQVSESNDANQTYNTVAITVTGAGGNSANAASAATVDAETTLELSSAYAGTVTFASKTGTLVLDSSSSFTGTVSGFGDNDELDLSDVSFGSTTTLGYSGTTAGGTLSVTDGFHSAKVALLGNYMASTFVTSSDGHGGTLVTESLLNSASQPQSLAQPHA